ncbi:hypothetical protein SAMN06298212_11058 [Ruaniaceae bacterium KH17]|nr:hypothetical protein SAMN06298212_11058 [Ruaniaceae bacterium KH17]
MQIVIGLSLLRKKELNGQRDHLGDRLNLLGNSSKPDDATHGTVMPERNVHARPHTRGAIPSSDHHRGLPLDCLQRAGVMRPHP